MKISQEKMSAEKYDTIPMNVVIVAVFASLLPLAPLFLSEGRLLYRDLLFGFLPNIKFILDSIANDGFFPLWNRTILAGTPVIGDSTNGPIYPFNIIFYFFGPLHITEGYLFLYAFHWFSSYIAAYRILHRGMALPHQESLLLSLPFIWNGFAFSATCLPQITAGMHASLWVVAAWSTFLRKGGWGNFLVTAMALALPIYGGDPQFFLIAALILPVWSFFQTRRTKLALSALAAIGLAVIFSAAQLLPMIPEALASARGMAKISLTEAESWSLHPLRLLEVFFAYPWGLPADGATPLELKLTNGVDPEPFIFNIYGGVIYGALATLALTQIRSLSRVSNLFLLSCFGLFLALGKYTFLFALFHRFVPFWSAFRFPERLGFWFLNGFLLCFIRIYQKSQNKNSPLLFIPTLAGLILYLIFFSPWFLVCGLAISGTAFLLINVKKHFILLMIIAALDMLFIGRQTIFSISKKILEPGPILTELQTSIFKQTNEEPSRFLSPRSNEFDWDRLNRLKSVLSYREQISFHHIFNLSFNIGSIWGLNNAGGYSAVVSKEKHEYLLSKNWKSALDPYLLIGMRYIISRDGSGKPGLGFRKDALPFVYTPEKIQLAANFAQALAITQKNGVQSREIALESEIQPLALSSGSASNPKVLLRNGRSIKITVSGNQGLLVVNESFHRNWRAFLDGRITPLYRANAWSMAIPISNAHVLELIYSDPYFSLGLWITSGSLLLSILLYIWLKLSLSTIFYRFLRRSCDSKATMSKIGR